MFNAFSYSREHLSEIDFPYLLIHGDADKICKVQGARNLFQVPLSLCVRKEHDGAGLFVALNLTVLVTAAM